MGHGLDVPIFNPKKYGQYFIFPTIFLGVGKGFPDGNRLASYCQQ
jgi:hypothetical protein